jgi:prepilin signal peptidase PulO-like enzyme (type II secretory pathway)
MVGTFLPWLGAWILANQAERNGRVSVPAAFGTAVGFAVVVAVIAVLVGFPGAHWNVTTFGVAFLPGLALATVLSGLGTRRA